MTKELTEFVHQAEVCSTYQLKKSNSGYGGFICYYHNYKFNFEELVAKLVTAFGEEVLKGSSDNKTSIDICLDLYEDEDKICSFSLYDYKEDFTLHIGGLKDANDHKKDIIDALNEFFSATESTPYVNKTKYDQQVLYSWDK